MRYFIILVLQALIFVARGKARKSELKFVVLGDIGGVPVRPYFQWSQRLVSKRVATIPNVAFFVTTGDNFYYRGVQNVDDFRFYATFERVYNDRSLQRNWYVIAGNHDYYGNVSAQILYTRKSKRWIFPDFYHTKVFSIPNSNKTLQIVMIDTTALCFTRIPKKQNAPTPEVQMKWIKNTLNESKSDYLIVVGHHPMYSAGRHGNSQCLQDKLLELFKKHKVNAYISGHDHNLQHIVPEDSSLEYFVCGSSNFFTNWQPYRAKLANSLKILIGNKPGFLVVTAKEKGIKFEFRTIDPKQNYSRFLPLSNQSRDYIKREKYPKLLEDFFRSLQTA